MDLLITLFAFFLLIGIIIVIHEGGHFLASVISDVKVLEFSIGMGPVLLKKIIGKDQTIFTLRAFPIGGFVKPLDKSALTEEEWNNLSDQERGRSFKMAKRYKKAFIVAAGPLSNFILAGFIFVIAFLFVGTKGVEPVIGEVKNGSVFAQAGIKVGDKLIKVDNRDVYFMEDAYSAIVKNAIGKEKTEILINRNGNLINKELDFTLLDFKKVNDDFAELMGFYFKGVSGIIEVKRLLDVSPLKSAGVKEGDRLVELNNNKIEDINFLIRNIRKLNKGDKVDLLIEREGQLKNFKIEPVFIKERGAEVAKVGGEFIIQNPKNLIDRNYSIKQAFVESGERVYDSTVTTFVSLKKLAFGEMSLKALSGPIAIADYSGKSFKKGMFSFLMMMAAISIAVGAFNLLPIPVLDGGHLLQYSIEMIRNKDFSDETIKWFQYVGIFLIGGVFVLAIGNDLLKYSQYLM